MRGTFDGARAANRDGRAAFVDATGTDDGRVEADVDAVHAHDGMRGSTVERDAAVGDDAGTNDEELSTYGWNGD